MAQIMTGGLMEFESITTVPVSYQTNMFLSNMYTNWQQQLSPMQQSFYGSLGSMYNYVDPEQLAAIARETLKKHSDLWRDHIIAEYSLMQHFQNASPVMQPWIMAMPEMSQLYIDGSITGYATNIPMIDHQSVGMDRYHYRRAIDGMYMEDGTATIMYEDIQDPTHELTRVQQVDIQNTWDNLREFLNLSDTDPTSASGGRR